MTPDVHKNRKEALAEYQTLNRTLHYSVHELPAGVLWGPDGATPKQCAELMEDLYRFEELSRLLNMENQEFIEGCRWHFEHYPHFLSRQKHFKGYAEYIQDRSGPLRVTA